MFLNGFGKTFVIAEAGVNHNGCFDQAIELIDVAVEAGADAVKFQTFKPEALVVPTLERATYQAINTGSDKSQFQMLQDLALDRDWHFKLRDYCIQKRIDFLSTPFDDSSLTFLHSELGLQVLKIPSGEITNGPLLLEFAKTGCNLILSTGMSNLGEIEQALSVLAAGFLTQGSLKEYNYDIFRQSFCSSAGKAVLREKVTLLHCSSEYPAPFDQINLKAIKTLSTSFGLPVGYSDHSVGISVPIAAIALGATVIEKHFTLDKDLPGPDHKASLEPHELKEMIKAIRDIEKAFGDGIKTIQPCEFENEKIVRKCLVAKSNITKGTLFTDENITQKRASGGLSPMEIWDILDRPAWRSFTKDEVIG